MLKSYRIKLIKKLIDINEHFFFERRLKRTYKALIGNNFQTIIDVGANKGQTIDFFKKTNKKCQIFAFEPNKDLYQLLSSKYRDDLNVQIFNFGISDEIGEKVFHQNILDYTSTFENLNFTSSYLKNKSKILGVSPENIVTATYSVKTTTLSDFINSRIKQTIDIIKIDVEGHEYHCLVGLFNIPTSCKIRFIQLEKHNDDMYLDKIPFEKITQLLNRNGFKIKTNVKHGFGNIEEVIFYNTSLQ